MEGMDPAGVAELMRGLGLDDIAETVTAEWLTGSMLVELIKLGGLAEIGAKSSLHKAKIAGEVEQRQRRATITRDADQAGMDAAPAPKRAASGSRGAAGEDSGEEQDSDDEGVPPPTANKPKKRRRRTKKGASTKKPKAGNDIRHFFKTSAAAAAGKTPDVVLKQRRAELEKEEALNAELEKQEALNQEAEYEAKVEREKTRGPATMPAAFKVDHKKLAASVSQQQPTLEDVSSPTQSGIWAKMRAAKVDPAPSPGST